MTDRVTVIIPTLGDSKHLHQAINSALTQEDAVQVLVVHDRRPGMEPLPPSLGSDRNVRLLESVGEGPSNARNTGLTVASSELVAFLDDDDLFLPGHFARSRQILGRYTGAVGVAAAALFFQDHSPDASAPPPADLDRLDRLGATQVGAVSLRDLLLRNLLVCDSVVLRRDRLGDARFDPTLFQIEDYDLWLRLTRRAPLVLDPRAGVLVRKRPGSNSRNLRLMATRAIEVIERQVACGLPPGTLSAGELAQRLGRLYHDLAYACLIEDDLPAVRRALRHSITRVPFLLKNYIYATATLLPRRVRRAALSPRQRA